MSNYIDKLTCEVKDFIQDNGIVKNETLLKSGQKSDVYFDIKGCIVKDVLFTESLLSIINSKLSDTKHDTIAGIALGGVLIADRYIQFKHNTSYNTHINYLVIRSKAKEYGMKSMVIGDVKEAKNVVIIEDVITTGTSVILAIENLLQVNLSIKIAAIVSIIHRDKSDQFERICDYKKYKYLPIFKMRDFSC